MKTKINELLKESGQTQQQMADYLGISQASFYAYTIGKAEPSLEKLIKLADYFGCSVDYLIGHQTSNMLQIDDFSENKKAVLHELSLMTDDQVLLLIGYIERIKEQTIENAVNKIKYSK